jgi:hypothetical protein
VELPAVEEIVSVSVTVRVADLAQRWGRDIAAVCVAGKFRGGRSGDLLEPRHGIDVAVASGETDVRFS